MTNKSLLFTLLFASPNMDRCIKRSSFKDLQIGSQPLTAQTGISLLQAWDFWMHNMETYCSLIAVTYWSKSMCEWSPNECPQKCVSQRVSNALSAMSTKDYLCIIFLCHYVQPTAHGGGLIGLERIIRTIEVRYTCWSLYYRIQAPKGKNLNNFRPHLPCHTSLRCIPR